MKSIGVPRLLTVAAVAAVASLALLVTGVAGSATAEPRPLAGLTNDKTVYLADHGQWHAISADQFKLAGLSQHAIVWYDNQLPGTIGGPATSVQVAQASAQYQKTLADLGIVTEVVAPAAAKPVISAGKVVHAATAGHPFVVSYQVTRNDNGEKLAAGTLTSKPSVAGKAVSASWASFDDGVATVLMTVPAAAKGKMLTVPVTIKSGTESSQQVATFKIG